MKDNKVFQEIIKEIYEAVKKLKASSLADILKKYKFGKEEDVRDMLLSWNIDFKEQVDDDEEGKGSKKKKVYIWNWVQIKDYYFPVDIIFSINRDEYWQYGLLENKKIYTLSINKGVETKNTTIKEVTIKYDYLEEREKEIESLKEKLSNFNIKFI